MIGIAFSEQAAPAFGGLEQHAVSPRVWRTIGNAMLSYVNIDARPKWFVQGLTACSLHNLLNHEIGTLRFLAVQKGGGNPDLIGHFDLI
jgi:hypothetical protein